jgi:hypothetical protein
MTTALPGIWGPVPWGTAPDAVLRGPQAGIRYGDILAKASIR